MATINRGDKVKVNSGATDYYGKSLASFVYNETWIVSSVSSDGNRVVIDKSSTNPVYSICTAMKASDLTVVSSSGSGSGSGSGVGVSGSIVGSSGIGKGSCGFPQDPNNEINPINIPTLIFFFIY